MLVAYCALRIFTTQVSDKNKVSIESSKIAKGSTVVLLQLNSFPKVYFTLPYNCKHTCIDLALAIACATSARQQRADAHSSKYLQPNTKHTAQPPK